MINSVRCPTKRVLTRKQHCPPLLLLRLGRHEAHLRALGRDDNRLGIGRVVLLALDERTHVLRRNQLDLVAKPDQFARPVMRAAASLHHHHCWRLLRHELPELRARQLLAVLNLTRHPRRVQLKNILGQIHADHDSLRHGCRPFRSVVLNTTFLAHRDAVEGGRQPPHLIRN